MRTSEQSRDDVESDFFLLLCGDVEHNPGPKMRSSICCLPIRRNQKALLCDFCEL